LLWRSDWCNESTKDPVKAFFSVLGISLLSCEGVVILLLGGCLAWAERGAHVSIDGVGIEELKGLLNFLLLLCLFLLLIDLILSSLQLGLYVLHGVADHILEVNCDG